MPMSLEERTQMLVRTHGEVCTKAAAARILGRSAYTLNQMLEDGRIEYACAGTRVDVRSIARYISQPKQADFEAKKHRIKLKYNSEFVV